jgi:ATP-binding cassette subfamily C protein
MIIGRYRSHLGLVALASLCCNLLVFAGSGYMLLVYDTVLPARSVASLIALFAMLIMLYALQALFEAIRGEALLGLAQGVHDDLFPAVHHATVMHALRPDAHSGAHPGDGLDLIRDLDALHAFLAGSGPVALIDLPWVLVLMIVLFALHPWLGLAALGGTLVMAALALGGSLRTRAGSRALGAILAQRGAALAGDIRFAETALAMDIGPHLARRTMACEARLLRAQADLARTVLRWGGASRTLRIALQSVILTVGALLVIEDRASGGVILASSVLAGRALAPVDLAIANWHGMVAARSGWHRLTAALAQWPRPQPRGLALPPPRHDLTLHDLWVAPPGSRSCTVEGVTLTLGAGQVLALIGPSAAGKSTLVRAMLGIWPPLRGEVRIDGATPGQWALAAPGAGDGATLGRHIGYVPQTVDLIEGTIGENIARFDPAARSGAVIAAAQAAGLHAAILALPAGYDTPISAGGAELSAGQRQRASWRARCRPWRARGGWRAC